MAQQTAVEWLIEQLIFKKEYEHLPNNYFLMSDKDIDNIIEQANKMFEEQIINAWDDGDVNINRSADNGEQYYTETYGK